MNSTFVGLIALFGAVLGGALGAFVTIQVVKPGPAVSAEATKAGGSPSPEDEDTEREDTAEEVQGLRTRVRGLEARVSLLSFGRSGGGGGAGALASAGAGGGAPSPEDPAFELGVREILDRVEAERDGERGARHEQGRRERGERMLQVLTDRLGLNEAQKTRFSEISQRHATALRALREQLRAEPSLRSERRERMNQLRDQAEAEVRTVLDPTQLQKYEALDEGDRVTARRGRRGGGDGREGEGWSGGAKRDQPQ